MIYIIIYISIPILLAIFGFSSWRQDLYSWFYSLVGRGASNLSGQRIWVVGCSQGIGEDIVYQLAAAKCELILSARTHDKLVNVARACEKYTTMDGNPNKPLVVPFDMTKLSEHGDVVRGVLEQVERLDGVVLCAGRSQRSLVADMDLEVIEQLFKLNTLAPMGLTRALLPHFIQNKRGRICVIGSLSARVPATIMAAYGASKSALQSYFTTLRYENTQHNIKVTISHPGQIQTNAPKEVFRETISSIKREYPTASIKQNRMSSKDCAAITVTAMGNDIHEVWMSNQPVLFLSYIYHFGCGFLLAAMEPLIRKMSNQRINAFKEGKPV